MPNRILKESICVSDSIDHLSWFEEVLFYRLIVNCDDFGRFDGRTAVIKNRLFPLKDDLTLGTVKSAIHKLVSAGLVITYENMGKPYLYLPTWTVHQTPRAKKSKYPAPGERAFASVEDVKKSEIICKQMQADAPDIRDTGTIFDIRDTGTGTDTASGDVAAAVMADYLNRINPQASATSLDELRVFAEEMGEECCKRAFDIALDAKKATWPYIRAILRAKHKQGVRCLADWDALDAKREHEQSASVDPYKYEKTEGSL